MKWQPQVKLHFLENTSSPEIAITRLWDSFEKVQSELEQEAEQHHYPMSSFTLYLTLTQLWWSAFLECPKALALRWIQ